MKGSANAKFIVCGEHAVVHGAPCLAIPLKQATLEVTLHELNHSDKPYKIIWNSQELSQDHEAKAKICLETMGFSSFFKQALLIEVKSQIPIGSGLGSSAALCVALAKTLPIPESEVLTRAYLGENVFHGNASGVDPACVYTNKPIVFETNPIQIKNLKLPKDNLGFWVLRNSGIRHQTSEVLHSLQKIPAEDHKKLITDLSKASRDFIDNIPTFSSKTSHALSILDHISTIHKKMNLIVPEMEEAMDSLRQEGAQGVKLTGAGRGGYVLGFFVGQDLPMSYKARKDDYVVTFSGDDVIINDSKFRP